MYLRITRRDSYGFFLGTAGDGWRLARYQHGVLPSCTPVRLTETRWYPLIGPGERRYW